MKALDWPALAPHPDKPGTLPVAGIGEYKAGGITQVRLFIDDDPARTAIALQPDRFSEDPIRVFVTMATRDLEPAEATGVLGAQPGGHLIDPVPLALPLKEPRAFQFRHPVLPVGFDAARQRQAQDPVIKSSVGLRKLAFGFERRHDRYRDVRALAIADSILVIMQ